MVLKKVFHDFQHQLEDMLNDRDTHDSIVTKLQRKSVISQEAMVAQKRSIVDSSSLLSALCLEDKPNNLVELITVMMDEDKAKSLAVEMNALLCTSNAGTTFNQFIIS